jgi:hypothetical protein
VTPRPDAGEPDEKVDRQTDDGDRKNIDGSAKSPLSALRCISKSLRRT